jgi:hypothetical protein
MLGIDKLTHLVRALDQKTDHLIHMLGEIRGSLHCLERIEKQIMAQIDDMNVKLDSIANTETKLGQDIQQVVDVLKANPSPTDLTQQLAKLDTIAQSLIDTDAATLANLPPTPAPPPLPGRRR